MKSEEGIVMGNIVDYITPPPETLDRKTQHLTRAELDRLRELLAAEDGE
ncbi:hypothetical protein [Streptosporangium roseum]|uniref:Uncharacterized protein n=1 Tax=Streptosporangium roseum (strain ATCC 12428 / DSM 43021 / JCM 3005 / KCTC 9067 / NCIMB 10171 / NRRL 2505 / NI 9100) TaxID=479432 RepID=D2BAE4_STRRD|nr:hypothetical protein [Streptosporangium roseum]ACZ87969.1 hypothetical protein Sros_5194 [Streptosporangium roseum DSM 43021]